MTVSCLKRNLNVIAKKHPILPLLSTNSHKNGKHRLLVSGKLTEFAEDAWNMKLLNTDYSKVLILFLISLKYS